MGDISAVAGERLVLTCPVGGYPIHSRTWFKEGAQLPVSRRQVVHPNGSLVIDNVQRVTDAGTYSCTASARHGDKSTQAVQVKVLVPPRIGPFTFRENAAAGIRVSVSCSLEQGDLPVTIRWLKDGELLTSDPQGALDPHRQGSLARLGLKVRFLDAYSSQLVIPNLSAAHAGNYTCQATNAARTVTYTAPLTVSVPPRWVSEPEDQSVPRGGNALIHCQTEGFPPPKVLWRKAHGTSPGVYRDLLGTSGVQQLTNGSLLLSQVTKDSEGRYLCEATNGIGAGLSKVVQLSVNAPPRFSLQGTNVSVGTGSLAMLRCPVTGDQPMKLSWHKDGRLVMPSESYRHELRESTSGGVGRRACVGRKSGCWSW
ncbi:Down syndrome cell adhesion molecule-like protein Dscam2 isoform X1 [Homarus americanus]|uniref:Down syndrome cell adhesion molecule-like protein Dscam2 isoform X1 n=1 Tax=Homarus americanus TaxID=6706 RepID=UPI001C48631C|nr:Down syndrome cell adhesion molecule-like protein Dscam2 isoform X1 [Homarus americanus]